MLLALTSKKHSKNHCEFFRLWRQPEAEVGLLEARVLKDAVCCPNWQVLFRVWDRYKVPDAGLLKVWWLPATRTSVHPLSSSIRIKADEFIRTLPFRIVDVCNYTHKFHSVCIFVYSHVKTVSVSSRAGRSALSFCRLTIKKPQKPLLSFWGSIKRSVQVFDTLHIVINAYALASPPSASTRSASILASSPVISMMSLSKRSSSL
ncbi:hypothetical protein SRABI118_03047 [Massilia sp. Bi118]|nr:hypothetical protein SRABI118_03047 [Massilia sp. Bi118]